MTFRKIISLFLFFICIGLTNVSADDNDSTAFTGYFGLATGFSASDVWSGNIFLNRISGNFWVMTYTAHDIGQYVRLGAGHKELSAELTSIKF